jgi:hypothetical protein
MRFGGEFTEEDLRPDVYATPVGVVEARLVRGPGVPQIDELLRTYTIDGEPCLGYVLPHDADRSRLTQHGAEINGAVVAFALANIRGVALRTGFRPPHPDLAVTAEGESAALEMTEARPEGAFTAALRNIEATFGERISADDVLRKIVARRSIGIGFGALPPSRRIPALVDALLAWVASHDWDAGDPAPPAEPALAEFVVTIGRRGPDPERPIRAEWHIGARPIPSGLALILGAVVGKNRKIYNTSPLWLGINANLSFGEMRAVKLARIDPGQFDRIYITDGQDAVTVKRLRA